MSVKTWTLEGRDPRNGYYLITGPSEWGKPGSVNVAVAEGEDETQMQRNALLIAAAPDLLALVKQVESASASALKAGSPSTFMDLVALLSRFKHLSRAAIAKAEGASK